MEGQLPSLDTSMSLRRLSTGSCAAPEMSNAGITPCTTSTLLSTLTSQGLGCVWIQRIADIIKQQVQRKSSLPRQ